MELKDKHIILQLQSEIEAICRVLFDNLPINYFEYARYYKNGNFWSINTNSDITKLYLKNNCYPTLNEFAINTSRYIFMSQTVPLPQAARKAEEKYLKNIKIFENFNINHRIYIDDETDAYFDGCGFGTELNGSKALEIFVNNLDVLENFRKCFLVSSESIIKACEKSPIKLFPQVALNIIQRNKKRDKANLLISYNINGVTLSKREGKCLRYLAHGKTMKEIANMLNISYKTVQTYLDRTKQKLGCKFKSQLVELYWSSQGIFSKENF